MHLLQHLIAEGQIPREVHGAPDVDGGERLEGWRRLVLRAWERQLYIPEPCEPTQVRKQQLQRSDVERSC